MQTSPIRVEIPQFPLNKRIAFTTSWDDGHIDDRRLIDLLNRCNLQGTFNLISGAFGRDDATGKFVSAGEVASLYAGHEVAIHTVTHPNLCNLDSLHIAREIIDNRSALEDLVGYPVRGMAYPYGAYSEKVQSVLRSLGIEYARTVERQRQNFLPPADPLAWAPTCDILSPPPMSTARQWESFYEKGYARGVFCVWGHSYEIGRRNEWPAVERFFSGIACREDVWCCTNIAMFEYEAARNRMVVAANNQSAYNPSAMTVTLNVDGRLIDVPAGQTLPLTPVQLASAA